MTDHDWAMASIRHSSLLIDPSHCPASVKARRYHCPSQACSSIDKASCSLRSRYRSARSASPCCLHKSVNRFSTSHRNQPSHTLSPRPLAPTRLIPSFQSPIPISGSPCSPKRCKALSMARRQCSKMVPPRVDIWVCSYRSCSSSRKGSLLRNGAGS